MGHVRQVDKWHRNRVRVDDRRKDSKREIEDVLLMTIHHAEYLCVDGMLDQLVSRDKSNFLRMLVTESD